MFYVSSLFIMYLHHHTHLQATLSIIFCINLTQTLSIISFKNILHTLIQKHFTHTHSKTFYTHSFNRHFTHTHSKTFYTHSFKNILHTLIQKHFTHTHSKTFYTHSFKNILHTLIQKHVSPTLFISQTLCGVLSIIFMYRCNPNTLQSFVY